MIQGCIEMTRAERILWVVVVRLFVHIILLAGYIPPSLSELGSEALMVVLFGGVCPLSQLKRHYMVAMIGAMIHRFYRLHQAEQ